MMRALIMKKSSGALVACFAGLVFALPGGACADIVGFDNGANFTVNSSAGLPPTISNGVLPITNNNVGETHTVFYNTPQSDNYFVANFIYQASGNKAAEGVAFVLQNSTTTPPGVGPHALGIGGAGLGYIGISPSVAFEMNINSQNTMGIALGLNGSNVGPYTAPGSINLASGDRIGVRLSYNPGSLSAVLTDLDNASIPSFSTNFAVNIPTVVLGPTAFVGFTGATGASTSIQTLSGFTFSVPEPSAIIMGATSCVVGLCTWCCARRRRKPA
jgi:hypothetical protein